jgi:hypothetical protein
MDGLNTLTHPTPARSQEMIKDANMNHQKPLRSIASLFNLHLDLNKKNHFQTKSIGFSLEKLLHSSLNYRYQYLRMNISSMINTRKHYYSFQKVADKKNTLYIELMPTIQICRDKSLGWSLQ